MQRQGDHWQVQGSSMLLHSGLSCRYSSYPIHSLAPTLLLCHTCLSA